MTVRPAALWRFTDLSRFATAADGIYYVCHASENSPWWMKHFTVCNIQFPECRRLTLFSCVMTFLTSWKACVVMIETTCPVKVFAQCVCWELFHPITPSVSSMWFLLSSTYMLYFLVFLFFVMISQIGNIIVRMLLYSVNRKPLQFPLIFHYLYMSRGASTKTIYVFWRLWSMGFKLLEKHNFISFSNAFMFIYKQCRTRESL